MTRMNSFKAILAAGVCLLPLAAFAQSTQPASGAAAPQAAAPQPAAAQGPGDNWFTVGGQYNSSRSYYLGRFSGAVDPGFYGLGDFHIGQRDAWDSGGTMYWQADGANLGMWDRSFDAKLGQQGTWGVEVYYQGIPYYATDSYKSIYQRNGTLVPGVARGSLGESFAGGLLVPKSGALTTSLWIPHATNSPAGKLFDYDLSTRRDIVGGVGSYEWQNWTITGAWRHDHKTGWQQNSMAIGGAPSVTSTSATNAAPTAFTSGLAYFPQPIDYDMDRYELSAAYGTPRMQVQLSYIFSRFTDNNTQFDGQNPFAFTSSASFNGSPANLVGIYTLPPSNSAHQVKAMLGYNITPTTRLNVNFGAGLQMQNEDYVNGIGGSNFAPQSLPRSSLDGLVETYFGNIALTSEPWRNVDVRVAYTMDDRNNQSPRSQYVVYPIDTTSSFTYFNLPFSYQHQALTGEIGYRFAPQAKVSLSDTLESTYRTYANTSLVTANRVTARVRGPLLESLFGSLSVTHEDRVAHNYNGNAWWSLACNTCNSEPAGFIVFFQASRKHDEIKSTLDYAPTNKITTSFQIKFANDHYPDGSYGLRNNHNLTLGPDVSWQVTHGIGAHAYYTYQQLYYDQTSFYTTGGYNVPWTAQTTDSVHTFGATVDWQAIPDKLKVSLDYNLAYGDTAYALGDSVIPVLGTIPITSPTLTSIVTMQPLPDVKSLLSVISIHGEYKLRPNMSVLFGYAWERFTYKDFMVGTSATQFSNALLPGTLAPNDSVHVVTAALRVRF